MYCATNFVYDENCHEKISNRRVIDLGAMLKLDSEKWNYLNVARRYLPISSEGYINFKLILLVLMA